MDRRREGLRHFRVTPTAAWASSRCAGERFLIETLMAIKAGMDGEIALAVVAISAARQDFRKRLALAKLNIH